MQNWDLLGTIFGRLYQIYIKMKNIPDIYWPGVFQYQDSNRTTDGSYTWISFIDKTQIISKTRTHRSQQSILLHSSLQHSVTPQVRVRNLGLAWNGTFLGPNLGLHYSACQPCGAHADSMAALKTENCGRVFILSRLLSLEFVLQFSPIDSQ